MEDQDDLLTVLQLTYQVAELVENCQCVGGSRISVIRAGGCSFRDAARTKQYS